ncbi:DNA damage-inducible protein I [Pectobacterium polaris]|uniref:DNA damage-inducible protein I n=1 Tax=Pectobacterium polaris TaxID=2042057 RepID=A0AAP9BKM8_9GAMM|nr:DNA damage-inducible protein I [Pectobacterium polaris]ASY77628.1 DNA damage-inducible protein I [Pectobacterium polaris]ASY79917.1 DNA damage-inducible protein I [Pectobacterium polaris]MBN3217760.1 DNA damage-inducible protein I [Pectobacterium polaris]MBW5892166.1 DNA damage-inducible protein I [Pectobacterium polaris]MCA6940379.1 DNA damage-inducible protein I [Pectobacterium polaris]
MRVEITLAKTTPLPAGAIEALRHELEKRIHKIYPDTPIQVRYTSANSLTVMGAGKEDKDRISEILQETWESADDWFTAE